MDSWFDLFKTDKLIHAGLFFGLVFLVFYPIYISKISDFAKQKWLKWIVLLSILWGVATELIQYFFVKGRSCDIKDILADSVGVLLCWVFFKILQKRKM